MKLLLYIEDEEPLAALYKDLFIKEGYEVETANDGEQGVEKALRMHPDVILLDIILPKLNGKLVLTKLRNDEWGKHVPVILFSNLDKDPMLLESNDRTYYLVKANVTPGEVVQKVKEILTTKKQ